MLLGLLLASGLGLAALLPIIAALRGLRAISDLRRLERRVAELEQRLTVLGPAPEHTAARDVTTASAAGEPAPLEALEPAPVLPPYQPPPAEAPSVVQQPHEALPSNEAAAGRLEAAIGGRLLLYAGVIVFVLGIGFFVKYAFEREWVTEELRVTIGGLTGAAMIALGLRLARAGYDAYGNILTGGGLAALYLSTYAAFSFYALIGRGVASTTLIAITAASAVLSDQRRAQSMAVMAVSGGFLTPFLVGSGTDAQLTLFSYVALLIAGTMVLARRRDWPFLNLVSYGFTLFTVMAWAEVYYTPAKYLRTELFLTLYCVMFVAILQQTRRSTSGWRDLAVAVLTTAPVLYHIASIAILGRHGIGLLIYLILFALVGVLWSVRRNVGYIRLFVWATALLPFLAWVDAHQATAWILPAIATLSALFALPLVAQIDRVHRLDQSLDRADILLIHANALATFFSIWVVLADTRLSWVPRIGLLLALVHAALARWLYARDRDAALHALAAAFSLVAATVAVELDARWITAAWAAEGAAVAWVGLRVRREWFRLAGLALLVVAAGRWIVLSAPETPVDFTLVFNEAFALGTWIIALTYALAWLHARATDEERPFGRSVAWLLVGASILTVVLLSSQNAAYWEVRSDVLADATFAKQLALSLLWAFYGAVLILVGIRRSYAPIRYAAMTLIGITVIKVFLVDLSGLEGIYRVLGLVLVGAVLLAVSFLYQRGRMRSAASESPGT